MSRLPSDMVDVPVEVVSLSSTRPLIRKGKMTCCDKGSCEVILKEPEPAFQTGMHVVVDGGRGTPYRIKGVISGIEGSRLLVEAERVVEPDKRAFPRVCGGVHLKYRVVSAGEDQSIVHAWIKGDETLLRHGGWREPDPFMNFSGSGLKFEDTLHCSPGDLLLMALRIGSSERQWHVTGRVVRVEALQAEDVQEVDETRRSYGATHRVAVHYEHIPEEAREALAEFTLKIQDALLGI